MSNNAFVDKLRVISVKYLPDKFGKLKVGGVHDDFQKESIIVHFWTFIFNTCKIISVKKTKETEISITYQFIT